MILRALAWLLVFLGIANFPTQVASDSVDLGWPVALLDGFARRGGVDLAFTYGPYGWLHGAAYLPGLLYPVIMLEVAFKGVLAAWVVGAAARLAALEAVLFVGLTAWVGREDALLWLGFLLAWRGMPGWSRPQQALACVWLALAALIKSTFLVVGALAVLLFAARYARSARDGALVAAAWVSSVLALWCAAGGRLAELPRWLGLVLEIVRGYPEGMGSYDRSALEVVAAAIAGLCVAVGARRELTVLDALIAFAVFKQAFVRHDAYHCGSFWAFLVLWPLVARAPRGLTLAAAAAGLAMLSGLRDLPDMARAPLDNARYLAHPATVEAGLAAQWGHYRAAFALPAFSARIGRGSVDAMPGCPAGVLLLNGLDYRPRPVFGYKTLTPALMDANAAHLRSERAPDFVIEAPPGVDDRWPEVDDALAREELRLRYGPVANEREYTLWARRTPRPAPARKVLITRIIAFGEPLALDAYAGKSLWLSARIAPTLAGRLLALALKSPVVTLRAGDARPQRVIPATAGLGFRVPAQRVVFGIGPVGRWCYDPVIEIRVEEIP